MFFRLANAPAIFQSYIYYILSDLLNIYYVIYLDNILIYSYTAEEHIEHIQIILQRLYNFKLYYKLNKYTFSTNIVNILRFIISL